MQRLYLSGTDDAHRARNIERPLAAPVSRDDDLL
jgi:hypothetical protein